MAPAHLGTAEKFARGELRPQEPGLRSARDQRATIVTGTCFLLRTLPRDVRVGVASVKALPGGEGVNWRIVDDRRATMASIQARLKVRRRRGAWSDQWKIWMTKLKLSRSAERRAERKVWPVMLELSPQATSASTTCTPQRRYSSAAHRFRKSGGEPTRLNKDTPVEHVQEPITMLWPRLPNTFLHDSPTRTIIT